MSLADILANIPLFKNLDEDDLATQFATQIPGTIAEMQSEQTDARITGLEFSFGHQFNQHWSGDMALEIIKAEDVSNNQDLPLIPANNLTLKGHYHPQDYGNWKNQKLSVSLKLVDEKKAAGSYEPFSQFDDMPFGTSSTDAYALWGLSYQSEFKFNKQSLLVTAAVDNLFDTAYVDFLNTYKGYTLNQGRNFKLGLRMQF